MSDRSAGRRVWVVVPDGSAEGEDALDDACGDTPLSNGNATPIVDALAARSGIPISSSNRVV